MGCCLRERPGRLSPGPLYCPYQLFGFRLSDARGVRHAILPMSDGGIGTQ